MTYQWLNHNAACPVVEFHDIRTEKFRSDKYLSLLETRLTAPFIAAGGLALAAHGLFGFSWRTALLIGTALAPTDPAVVFSVLGRREISGRSGTLLEGESGANDPVGIALMISILGTSSGGWSAVGHGAFEFVLQMVVGGAFGLAGAYALLWLMRRVPMPNDALYALRCGANGNLDRPDDTAMM